MQKTLIYIWRLFLVLLFLGGLGLIVFWLLRAYQISFLADRIPDDAFEPLMTLFAYVTGFSGVGAIAAWFAQKRGTTASSAFITTRGGDYAEQGIDKRQGTFQEIHHHYHHPSSPTVAPPAQPHGDYRKHYLRLVEYQCRFLDMKGMRTQSPHSLMLDQVFVALSVAPRPFHQASANPVEVLPQELRTGQHGVWEYLRPRGMPAANLAIIGAPGSGKTTILRHIALTLARPHRRNPAQSLKKIPILLFLRDHAATIHADPQMSLTEVIKQALTRLGQQEVPTDWFQRQLQQGTCLVMFDGLDEVADPAVRLAVVAWVEQQMKVYGDNRFIITSRPFGYKNNPLSGVTVLEVQPFTPEQVKRFVHNWYQANEIMSAQKDDPGVRLKAWSGAEDLLRRLRENPAIGDLTVNPLLLTMIANVHRYRDSLPGSRVELYAEVCEVFLGRRQASYGIVSELKAQQKQSVLQPLAYQMMCQEQREISKAEALPVIADPLQFVTTSMTGEVFLQMIENSSGLLLERENGVYSFAHLTFQEYLTATHIREQNLVDRLVAHVGQSWWRETIRLYAAQADATPIIAACLKSATPSLEALVLARDCADEAKGIQPAVRIQLEEILTAGLESDDPEHFQLAAEVLLARRLKALESWQPIDEQRAISTGYITCAEYQLFLDEMRTKGEYYQPDHWTEYRFKPGQALVPITGMRGADAEQFCTWLTARQTEGATYRLPTPNENRAYHANKQQETLSVWCQAQASGVEFDNPTIAVETPELVIENLIAKILERLLARDNVRARSLIHSLIPTLVRADALGNAIKYILGVDIVYYIEKALYKKTDETKEVFIDMFAEIIIEHTYFYALDRTLNYARDRDQNKDVLNALAAEDYRQVELWLNAVSDNAGTRYGSRRENLRRALRSIHSATDGVAQRRAWRRCVALLLRYAWVGYEMWEADENAKKTDYAVEKDAVLTAYLWLEIVIQREVGELPAWEGIRLVRERQG